MTPDHAGSTSPGDEKSRLRRSVLSVLQALSPDHRAAASRRLCDRFLISDLYKDARVLLAFFPVREEPDLRPVIERALADGKTLALPRTDWAGRAMLPCAIATTAVGEPAGLVRARFGLLEPGPAAEPLPPEAIDLILIPGVAFDRAGRRLGRGAGFYDRFLAPTHTPPDPVSPPRPVLVGVAHAEQILPRVPTEPHDRPVDFLLTPDALIRCAAHGT